MLESICRRATCSDLPEKIATDGQRSQGLDIADFLPTEDTPQMILARMIECNPVLQTFIDTFGLELVDAGRKHPADRVAVIYRTVTLSHKKS